jgi:hypothetical protein
LLPILRIRYVAQPLGSRNEGLPEALRFAQNLALYQ